MGRHGVTPDLNMSAPFVRRHGGDRRSLDFIPSGNVQPMLDSIIPSCYESAGTGHRNVRQPNPSGKAGRKAILPLKNARNGPCRRTPRSVVIGHSRRHARFDPSEHRLETELSRPELNRELLR